MQNRVDCPLCLNAATQQIFSAKAAGRLRPFFHCAVCDLLYVPKTFHVSLNEEKQKYGMHNNDSTDSRYIQFLGQMIHQVCTLAGNHQRVLDFGSGPQPVLAGLLGEKGYQVDLFDPFFSPDKAGLQPYYATVTCCEVIEHFNDPQRSWQELIDRMAPQGKLFVMTHRRDEVEDLAQWYYIRDITHVAFYSKPCLQWIGDNWNLEVRFLSERVALLTRR